MSDAHNALDVNNGQQACRRYIYTTSPILVIHIAPPISSSRPFPRSIHSSLAVPPSRDSPSARRYPLPPSARMYAFIFLFFFFWKRDIRGRNRKRHGRVSNRYSAAVSHRAGPQYYRRERARCNEMDCNAAATVTPAAGTRSITRMRFEFARLFLQSYVVVQIGRASRTYARKLSSVFLAARKNTRGRAARKEFRARICSSIGLSDLHVMLSVDHFFFN